MLVRLDVCLFYKVLEPKLQRFVFLMIDIIHFASSQVQVARVQRGSAVVPCAVSHIGTELAYILALCLSE